MQLAIRLAAYVLMALAIAFAIEQYGFGIAHSAAWVILITLLAPGFLIVFFLGGLGALVSWSAFVLINCVYYEAIYRAVFQARRHRKSGHVASVDKPKQKDQ